MITEKMTSEDYHASDAVSSTQMKQALISPAHYLALLTNPPEPTAAMEMGTAVHSAILEKDFSKYVEAPPCRRGTKEWTAFEEANPNKILLKTEEYKNLVGMYDAFYAHPMANKIAQKGKAELSIFDTDPSTGLRTKARIDYLVQNENGNYILDYKTTTSANTKSFLNSIFNYRYDLSMAHYKDLAEKAISEKISDVFLIAQEKEAPYGLRVFRMSDRMLEIGLNDRNKALYIINEAKKKNYYPCYEETIQEVDFTEWQYRDLIGE